MHRNPQPRPPETVLSTLDLHPHERALAWARASSGEWYVGTNLALHLPMAGDAYRRLPWEAVERADWQSESERLMVVEVADWGQPEQTTLVTIDEPGRLLELLRERITKSIVLRSYAQVRGSAGLSVVGRRSPSGDGPIAWSYVLSPGLDPADPDVIVVAERTLEEARNEVAGL